MKNKPTLISNYPDIFVLESPLLERRFLDGEGVARHMAELGQSRNPLVIDVSGSDLKDVSNFYTEHGWQQKLSESYGLNCSSIQAKSFDSAIFKNKGGETLHLINAKNLKRDQISKLEAEMLPFLEELTDYIKAAQPDNIYINCAAGRSRSLVTAIGLACYFEANKKGRDLDAGDVEQIALAAIEARNKDIDGNMLNPPGQLQIKEGKILNDLRLFHKDSEHDPALICLFTQPYEKTLERKNLIETMTKCANRGTQSLLGKEGFLPSADFGDAKKPLETPLKKASRRSPQNPSPSGTSYQRSA